MKIVSCRKCNIELNDENWFTSLKKSNNCLCKSCSNNITKENNRKLSNRLKNVEIRLNRKKRIVAYYGGKCACCGIDNIQLLSVDHINGGGSAHRKSLNISAGNQFYIWLEKNNYPSGFRILCYNCNCSLGHCGYCPHKDKPEINRKIKTTKLNKIIKGICRICNISLNDNNQFKTHQKNNKNICKFCFHEIEKNRLFSMKRKVFCRYGDKCIECNEKNVEFLNIDHINNDGLKERKSGLTGYKFFNWLIKNNYPTDRYQILCYNCNSKKEYIIRRTVK